MEKADIAKLADEAREKTEFETRMKNNANIVNREAVQDASMIRASDEIQGAKRKRAEAEARAKAEAEICKKTEKTRKAREANSKAQAETAERARAWEEVKEKEKDEISRYQLEQ